MRAYMVAIWFMVLASSLGQAKQAVAGQEASTASLTLVNLEPYKIYYALHYPVGPKAARTHAWWALEPGQARTVRLAFPAGVGPSVHVYGESGDPDVVRWLWDLPQHAEGRVYFEGPETEDVTFRSLGHEKTDRTGPIGDVELARTGQFLAAFVPVPLGRTAVGAYKGTYAFTTYRFGGIFDKSGLSDQENPLVVHAGRARLLGEACVRQARFRRSWPDAESQFPYFTGLGLDDHNGPDYPGLTVTAVDAKTSIFGDEMPFRVGDIVVRYAGKTVFHPADLHTLLYEHATDHGKGIEAPIDADIVREGRAQRVKSPYFFNPAHYPLSNRDRDKAHAVAAGLAETVGLGRTGGAVLEVAARNVGRALWNFLKWTAVETDTWDDDMEYKRFREPAKEIFEVRQEHARLRQMYPECFSAGTWVGFLAPSAPRLLFAKAFGRKLRRAGISRSMAPKLATGCLEVAEGLLWAVGASSPLRPRAAVLEDIKEAFPVSVAFGLISGALTRRARN